MVAFAITHDQYRNSVELFFCASEGNCFSHQYEHGFSLNYDGFFRRSMVIPDSQARTLRDFYYSGISQGVHFCIRQRDFMWLEIGGTDRRFKYIRDRRYCDQVIARLCELSRENMPRKLNTIGVRMATAVRIFCKGGHITFIFDGKLSSQYRPDYIVGYECSRYNTVKRRSEYAYVVSLRLAYIAERRCASEIGAFFSFMNLEIIVNPRQYKQMLPYPLNEIVVPKANINKQYIHVPLPLFVLPDSNNKKREEESIWNFPD